MSFCLRRSSTQSSRPHPVTVSVSVCRCVCLYVCVCVENGFPRHAGSWRPARVTTSVCVCELAIGLVYSIWPSASWARFCMPKCAHIHTLYTDVMYIRKQFACVCLAVCACVYVWAYVHVFAFICDSVRDNGSFSHSANGYKTRQFKAFAISSMCCEVLLICLTNSLCIDWTCNLWTTRMYV